MPAIATTKRSSSVRNAVFLRGNKLVLCSLELENLESGPYLSWLNDYEVTRFLETGMFPETQKSLRRYFEKVALSPDNILLAIIDRKTAKHIGNIKLGPIHLIHRRADLGILLGDKRFWGKGYGAEAIRLLLDYGFTRLNLHKITLGVYADHANAVALYKKMGFKIEGTLKEQLFRDDSFHDKYVMGILAADFRTQSKP